MQRVREKTREELQQEIDMLRCEIKVAREAAEITSDFVVKQFEQTEQMLHRFQSANAERQAVLGENARRVYRLEDPLRPP